jgi:hypothetical protein
MVKTKHNQICNLECKGYSPQSIGTGQCIKTEKKEKLAITEPKTEI